ncbi:MAG: ABC transporter permease [Oscillospiraceae bacterium]|nr:ABC transporter permease [Oscillospiraceae bacterium]
MKVSEAFSGLVRNQKASSAGKTLLRQVILILVAMVLTSLFLLVTGYDPFIVFKAIYKSISTDIGGTIRWMIPYGLMGLAVALTFRMNLFNMGVDGQLYLGAIGATYISMKMADAPHLVAVVATIAFAVIAGALFAVIPAVLKIRLNCDEVVVTILLNYVAYYFTDYLVLGPMLGDGTLATARSTNYTPENSWLTRLKWLGDSSANTGLFIMLAVLIGIAFIFYKTRFGYELKTCGANPRFARYGGINAGRVILAAMIISGAIAGATGAIEVMGIHHRFPIRFSNSMGNDGVVIALLASNNPFGILLTSFFFAALKNGSNIMQRIADVPSSLVDVVRGIIIFTVSARFGISWFQNRRKAKVEKAPGKEAA